MARLRKLNWKATLAIAGIAVVAYFTSQVRNSRFWTRVVTKEGTTIRAAPVAEIFVGGAVFGLSEDDDGQFWAATSGGVYTVDLKARSCAKVPLDLGPNGDCVYTAIRRDSHLFVSSWGQNASQFEWPSLRLLQRSKYGNEVGFSNAVFSTSGKRFVACTGNRPATAVVIDTEAFTGADLIGGKSEASYFAVAAHPREEIVALGDTAGDVVMYNLGTRTRRDLTVRPGEFIAALAYSPDSKQLGVGSAHGSLGVLNEAGEFNLLSSNHGDIESVCFSPDGEYLLAAAGHDLVCWHLPTRRRLNLVLPDRGDINAYPATAVVFSRDGSRILVGHDDRINVFKAASVLK